MKSKLELYKTITRDFENEVDLLKKAYLEEHDNFNIGADIDVEGESDIENAKRNLDCQIREIVKKANLKIEEIQITIDQSSLSRKAAKSLRKSTKTGLFTSDRKREAARVDYIQFFEQESIVIENESKTALDSYRLETRSRLEDSYKEVVDAAEDSLRRIRQRKEYLVKLSNEPLLLSVTHKTQKDRFGFEYDEIDLDLFDNSNGRLEDYVSENEEWLLNNAINDWGVWDLEQIQDFYTGVFQASTSHAHQVGYDGGHSIGHDEGFTEGHAKGFAEGRTEGHSEGHKEGYNEGYKVGKDEGYRAGYKEGNGDNRAQ